MAATRTEYERPHVRLQSGELVEEDSFHLLDALTRSWRARVSVEDGELIIVPDPTRPIHDDIIYCVEAVKSDLIAILESADAENRGLVH